MNSTPQNATGSISGTLFLVGAGKMGSAMLDGWLNSSLTGSQVKIFDPVLPENLQAVRRDQGIEVNADNASAGVADILLIAVKPQVMDQVLPQYKDNVGPNTLVISVAAGIPISMYETVFGADKSIVRCMPNTPAAVGQGMTVLYGNGPVTDQQKNLAQTLLEAVSEVAWISDEADMDAVTGVSGSGPAYVFHMIEAMTDAGIAEGLSPELARQLARTTVAGAGALVMESGEEASTLRENVTSPNGTTAAGLAVLMDQDKGLPALVKATVKAATDRSRELGKS